MNDNNTPQRIPVLVGQALAWLNKMGISYTFEPSGNFWKFEYDGLYMFIMNDVGDNELGLYGPAFIDLPECLRDADTYKMVFDFTISYLKDVDSQYDYEHVVDDFCTVSNWWISSHPKLKLYKRHFINCLKEMHQAQIDFCTCLRGSYEVLFAMPEEVMREITNEHKTTDGDE